jgi:phosphatidylglycerophosphate synthase
MLLGGLFVLICLHLLVEDHDLRPFAIPLLIISVLHLFVIVYRYIFTTDAIGKRVLGDFTIFIVMISISALMLMHIGILSSLRDWVDGLFSNRWGLGNNGNGGS